MSQSSKAPSFRGYVRKTVSPLGVTSWGSELRTKTAFTDLGQTRTLSEAIARTIEKACAPAGVSAAVCEAVSESVIHPQSLRQAA